MIFGAAWEGATSEAPENDKTGKLKGNLENFVVPGRPQEPPGLPRRFDLAVP